LDVKTFEGLSKFMAVVSFFFLGTGELSTIDLDMQAAAIGAKEIASKEKSGSSFDSWSMILARA